MRTVITLAVLVVAAVCTAVAAQDTGRSGEMKAAESKPEAKPVAYYRLDFTVNELEDGRKLNSRSYTAQLEAAGRGSRGFLKVGSRVPVGDGKGGFNYIDVGVNMEMFHINERDGLLIFDMNGDVSSIAAADQPQQGTPPVLRQARFGGPAVIAPGKPTVLYSLDDVNSKHRFQVEVVATKMK
ncbi:MAG: hypothetical protein ACE14L_03300 [Terriglobales bacterium]